MTQITPTPPAWYPDPAGRHQYRWWDGARWTPAASTNGQQYTDPLPDLGPAQPAAQAQPAGPAPVGTGRPLVASEAASVAATWRAAIATGDQIDPDPGAAGGTLFSELVLVLQQKRTVLQVRDQYLIFDRQGRQLGSVQQIAQSAGRKVFRAVSKMDHYLSQTMQVLDLQGQVLLRIVRPAKLVKSSFTVQDAHGREIGQIVQENAIGKINFAVLAGGQRIGSLDGLELLSSDYAILDAAGTELGRVDQNPSLLNLAIWSTADTYVLQLLQPIAEPMRSLVLASAICVDLARNQKEL